MKALFVAIISNDKVKKLALLLAGAVAAIVAQHFGIDLTSIFGG